MLQIDLQRAQVRFVPAGLDGRPWDGAAALRVPADVDAAAVDVVGDVPKPGVVSQNQRQIAQRVPDLSLPVHLQLFLPVLVLRRLCLLIIQIAELLRRLPAALLGEHAPGGFVLRGVLLHPADGVLFVAHMCAVRSRAARREQVQPHQIKGVAQLAARRVGGVVRIGELVVVNHQPARGAAAHEGVAVVLRRGGVPAGEDVLQHVRDAMRAAKGADDPALLQRVLRFGRLCTGALLQRLRGRPERGVRPVGIGGQHLVRVEKRLVRIAKHVLAVLRRAGPVHEPCRLKGRGVEAGQRQPVRDAAGDGGVLVRRDRAGKRDDEPKPHLLRRVAVGRVERVGVDERHVQIVHEGGVGVVRVQADQAAVDHARVATPAVFEITAHKPADVLDVVALGLAHGGVLGRRLPRAGGPGELIQKFAPEHLPVLPLRRLAAAARGDEQLFVVGDLHVGTSFGWAFDLF